MILKVDMWHRVLENYQVCSNYEPGLTLTYFTARSDFVPYASVWEEGKTRDLSEAIVVYDIKVGRYNHLNEYMKLYEYQRSRSFIDLGPNLSESIFLNFFSSITTGLIEAKFHMAPPWDEVIKACSNDPGHMTKMATMPICPSMVKTFKNLLLWNRKADDLETWYAALSTTKFV